MNQWFMGV